MKRYLLFVCFLLAIPGVFASLCTDDQTLFSLSSKGIALESSDQDTNSLERICYSDLFGKVYQNALSHQCNSGNVVIRLSNSFNAHAESPNFHTSGYQDICYGDLSCSVVSGSCGQGVFVASLSALTNAHLAKDHSYLYSLCCSSNNAGTQQAAQSNIAPTVVITSPSDGQHIPASTGNVGGIVLAADASDSDGNISEVRFSYQTSGSQGFTFIAKDNDLPYRVAWNSVTPGTYLLQASATDNRGLVGTSSNVLVYIDAASSKTLIAQWRDNQQMLLYDQAVVSPDKILILYGQEQGYSLNEIFTLRVYESSKTDALKTFSLHADSDGKLVNDQNSLIQVKAKDLGIVEGNLFFTLTTQDGTQAKSGLVLVRSQSANSGIQESNANVSNSCSGNTQCGQCGNLACAPLECGCTESAVVLSGCVEGQQTYKITTTCKVDDPDMCPAGSKEKVVPCRTSTVIKLPFFDGLQFLLTLFVLGLVYTLLYSWHNI